MIRLKDHGLKRILVILFLNVFLNFLFNLLFFIVFDKLLGEGGCGKVYLASEKRSISRSVCVVKIQEKANDDVSARIKKEIKYHEKLM